MVFRELRRTMRNDDQLKALKTLYRQVVDDRNQRQQVMDAIDERENEMLQEYVLNNMDPAQWNKVNSNIRSSQQRVREQSNCDCGSSRAHHINCPQHPGNLLPPVEYK